MTDHIPQQPTTPSDITAIADTSHWRQIVRDDRLLFEARMKASLNRRASEELKKKKDGKTPMRDLLAEIL